MTESGTSGAVQGFEKQIGAVLLDRAGTRQYRAGTRQWKRGTHVYPRHAPLSRSISFEQIGYAALYRIYKLYLSSRLDHVMIRIDARGYMTQNDRCKPLCLF